MLGCIASSSGDSYQDPVPRLAELEALTQEAAPSALKFAVVRRWQLCGYDADNRVG
jgi:hypothetical protein